MTTPTFSATAAAASAPRIASKGLGALLVGTALRAFAPLAILAPAMIGPAARVFGGLQGPLVAKVAAFSALSAPARTIGILRWLTLMPTLAASHARGDAAARAPIEALFGALTAYGGGIGEVLGVSLFMAASVGTLPGFMPVAAAVTALSFWMIAVGAWVAMPKSSLRD